MIGDQQELLKQKRISKHLQPLNQPGRKVSQNTGNGGGAPHTAAVAQFASPLSSHPLEKALSPASGRGGIKALGSIDHDKYKMKAHFGGLPGKPVERFRNLEPISKF